MKVVKHIFFLMFFLTSTTVFAYEANPENIEDIFAQATETIIQLTQLHDALTEQYEQTPTPELEADIIIINTVLDKIQNCLQELDKIEEEVEPRPNDDQNQQSTNEQIIQANQQQIINNLIDAIDQSNDAIEKLTQPKRWRYIKIGLYLLGGAAVVAGTIGLVYFTYKKLYSLFISPTDRDIQEQIEQTEDLGKKLNKNVTDIQKDLEPVKEDTRAIKRDLRKGVRILKNMKKDFPQLKQKINRDITVLKRNITVFKLVSDLRDLRIRERKKVDELTKAMAELEKKQKSMQVKEKLQAQEIKELNRRIRKETTHMRDHSKRLDLLLDNDLIVASELFIQKRELDNTREELGLLPSPRKKTNKPLNEVKGFGGKKKGKNGKGKRKKN